MGETIERAAIRFGERIVSVPRPLRHHDVFRSTREEHGILFGEMHTEEQGFMTSAGRFVDRKEGLRIALASGQIKEKHGPADILFSEDMW